MPHIRLIDQRSTGFLPRPVQPGVATPLRPPFVRDVALCTHALQTIAELTAGDGKAPSFRRLQVRLGLTTARPLHECLDDLIRTRHLRRLAGNRYAIRTGEQPSASGSA